MAEDSERGALFRTQAPHLHSRVTYAELFFDLVFVSPSRRYRIRCLAGSRRSV